MKSHKTNNVFSEHLLMALFKNVHKTFEIFTMVPEKNVKINLYKSDITRQIEYLKDWIGETKFLEILSLPKP